MTLRLKQLRSECGLTQKQLADALGVDLKTIGNWESGKTSLKVDDACRICLVLGCTPNDLCGWRDDHPNEASAACETDAFERELLRDYRACSAQWKSTISMTARAAAGESREEAQRDTVPSQRLTANS